VRAGVDATARAIDDLAVSMARILDVDGKQPAPRPNTGELHADVGALDTAAKACDTMAGELEKMRATLDARADTARDVLTSMGAT